MARALLSETERAAWSTWPPEDEDETIGAYFTLADGEAEQLRALGAAPVGLATALALAAIRWVGFVPDELAEAPAAGIRRLGDQLGVDASVLAEYRPSERRAREHRRRAAQLANFADADAADLEAVGAVLVEESLVHDSPVALLRTATRRLHERQRLRPGLTVLERIVAGARAQAERETYQRVEPMLDAATVQALDRLLVTDLTLKISRVTWLSRESTSAAPAAIVEQLEKLAFLRRLGADRWILDAVPANRRRHLAGLVRRSESQAIARRPGRVRHPALLCSWPSSPAGWSMRSSTARMRRSAPRTAAPATNSSSSSSTPRPRPTRRSACSSSCSACFSTPSSPTTRSVSGPSP